MISFALEVKACLGSEGLFSHISIQIKDIPAETLLTALLLFLGTRMDCKAPERLFDWELKPSTLLGSYQWLSWDFKGPCSSDQNIPWLTSTFGPPLLILVWSVLHIADRCFLPRFPHGLPSLFCPSFLLPDERAFTFCPVLALSSIFRVTPTKMRPPDLRPSQAAPLPPLLYLKRAWKAK